MASRSTLQDRIQALLTKYEPQIRDAFLASISDITNRAKLGAIIAALERGDIEGALAAVHVEPAAFQPLESAIRTGFVQAATTTAAAIPAQVVVRFDARNPAAEQWLSTHSSQAIVEIVADQRTAVRIALTDGMARGDNPRTTALNVVGRIGQSGRREGGIVGLTSQMERYVANARAELTSGNPVTMRGYFTRLRRDKRFDGIVLKAIKDGKPVDAATVSRLTSRYADRLLALRGETIGRTESMASIHEAQHQAYLQAVGKGAVKASAVRRTWIATKDSRTRDSHRHLDGTTVGLNERFPNGCLFPGDPSADIAEIANCRCHLMVRIDRLSNLE